MEKNIVVNAACVEYLAALPENQFDLTVTSPPYNLSIDYGNGPSADKMSYEHYMAFCFDWLRAVWMASKDDGRLCLNIPLDSNKGGKHSVYSDILQVAREAGWRYNTTVVWNEQNISRRTAWGSWKSASAPFVTAPVEMILVLYKSVWKKMNKGISEISSEEFIAWTNGVWNFSGEKKKNVGGHPAAFPLELPKRCIKLYSYVGDLILDPFSGSGTTLLAAKQNKRDFVGIELNKSFYDFSINRLKESC